MRAETRGLRVLSILIRVGVGVGALALGLGIFGFLASTRPQPGRVDRSDSSVSVRALRIEFMPIARAWEGYGTANAMDAANVAAQVTARVASRAREIEPGTAVRAGEVLMRLDASDFEQRVASAESAIALLRADLEAWGIERQSAEVRAKLARDEVALLEREYQRTVDAFDRGVTRETEVEAKLTALHRAQRESAALDESLARMTPRHARLMAEIAGQQASLSLARADLERTVITAPIDGILQRITGRPGELITAGMEVARVVNLEILEIPLRLPMSAHRTVEVGDAVEVRSERGGASWPGRVTRIAPEIDSQARSITVYAEVRRSDGVRIMPGEFVAGRVTSRVQEARALVPRGAVDAERVLIAEHGEDGAHRVRRAPVRVAHYIEARFPALDPIETQWAVIEHGLEPGDLVVTSNFDGLEPGMRITPSLTSRSARAGDTP